MAVWQTPKTDWTPSQQGVDDDDFNRIEGNTLWLKENLDTEEASANAIIRAGGTDSNTIPLTAIFDRTGQSITLSFTSNFLPFEAANTGDLTIYLGTGLPISVRPINSTGNQIVRVSNWTIPGAPVKKDIFIIAELVVLSTVDDTWEGSINFYRQQEDVDPFVVDAIPETSSIYPFVIDYRSPF